MKNLLMDLGIKSKAIADYIKELSRYLSMRDKMLWTGTLAHGQSLPLAVAQAINKYKRIRCRINISGYYGDSIFCEYRNGAYIGTAFLESWSTGAQISCQVRLLPSGSTLYLAEDSGYMTHAYKSNHSELYPLDTTGYYICAIEGVEPYMPESLKTFGGGYCLTRLLRWCSHENVHHLKEYAHTNPKCEVAYNRQQHAQKRICCIPEQRKNMLGILFESSIWRKSTSSYFVSRWICNSATRIFVHGILESAIQLLARCISRKSYTIPVRYTDAQQLSIDKAIRYFYNNRILNTRGCSVC